MADLLTHALVAYSVLTVLSWRVDWLEPPWITLGVCGAALPDLMKIRILVDPGTVSSALGLPFTWIVPGTLGGVLLLSAVVTTLFPRDLWRRTYVVVLAGAVLSLVGDWLRAFPDGHSDPWLYPFLPTYRPPTPGLYVTSDHRVLAVALFGTVCAVLADRYLV